MKKLLFALFVLSTFTNSIGQTLLNSHPLELRKSRVNHQILNAVNLKKEIFAIASDKETLTVLKYNKFLFFSDSLSISRPDKEYEFMAGYSFENNGNPNVYWATEDFKKLQSVTFDLENKTTKVADFQLRLTGETILNTFSENNFFYILALPEKEESLKIYALRKGQLYEKAIDFSAYKFVDEKGKATSFTELIRQNGLQMIDTKALNPLFETVGKSKMFVEGNKMILTFDSSERTQVLQIDLNSFSIYEQLIPQQILVKSGKSNSYFHQNKLYQLKTNAEELALAAVDLSSEETIKKYYADTKDTISFRNSPLFTQTGNQGGKALKSIKKFLQRVANSEIGLSVYKTPESIMLTVGGVRNVNTTGNILIGITAGAAMIGTGSGGDVSSFFNEGTLQSNYFEALFDTNFVHQMKQQNVLAVDLISQFLNENNVDLPAVFPFENYYILSYYDSKRKEFAMRKFEDVSD
ncbi:hypothetical protein [Flavobacterium macacae]|uniref:hypothetical protein n=1 Tax=Flavobacterium macacae TaxID=2488993 RepID=UPI0018F78736|nr:hypothetical protein [Flavobacterium macacae]